MVYGIKDGKSGSVNPGVFFYFTKVTVASGDTVKIDQTDGPSPLPVFAVRDVSVYNSPSCAQFSKPSCGNVAGDCTFTITFSGGGTRTFIIRVRYDSQSIGDANVCPNPPTEVSTFETLVNNTLTSGDSLTVTKKPNASC
jgi:hypothetical protein